MNTAHWRTSTHSSSAPEPRCVEVASGNVVRVRDAKDHERGTVTVSSSAWKAFLEGLGDRT